MLKSIIALLITVIAIPAFATELPQHAPRTDVQKTLYVVGLILSRELGVFAPVTPAEMEFVKQGLSDGAAGNQPMVDPNAYGGKIEALVQARRKAQGEKMAPANKEFLDRAAREKGAVKTDSGLVYLPITEGTGSAPGPADTVTVNYRGTLPDGTEFDDSYQRGEPVDVHLDGVIKCWNEGLQKMKPGGKAKLVCPSELAYGEKGAGAVILPGATLAFEVELVAVKKNEGK